jgi:transcriptional regulator with XRE-family HTH domain
MSTPNLELSGGDGVHGLTAYAGSASTMKFRDWVLLVERTTDINRAGIARRIGKSNSYVSRLFGEEITPSMETMAAIRRVSDGRVTPEDFYRTWEENQDKQKARHVKMAEEKAKRLADEDAPATRLKPRRGGTRG